jgi:hypothetical protein
MCLNSCIKYYVHSAYSRPSFFFFLQIWYNDVPHTKLVQYKGRQNWVKVSGEYLTFPGGGTQFKHGALHYIDFIQEVTYIQFMCMHIYLLVYTTTILVLVH